MTIDRAQQYRMKIGMQVLEHLGLNLYSNTSAVISEAVANSWDADATKVEIKLDTANKIITIYDNGSGMSADDINKKYLLVGYKKRSERATTPKLNRPYMGRKGIGKLSLFSIANTITLYSVKDGEKSALRLIAADLKEAINREDAYYPKPLPESDVDFDGDGTKIILSDLKKVNISRLAEYLKKRLARRFSVFGHNFDVSVDGSLITVQDRDYLPKAQYLWPYVPSTVADEERASYYASQCGDTLKKTFPPRFNFIDVPTSDGKTEKLEITGWIATAKEPSTLRDGDENLNRIVIMVRGKMAKENILPDISSSALYTKYIFGELNVEFLDEDKKEDIATSNRQDFNEEDARFIALKIFMEKELSIVRKDWEAERSNEGEEFATSFDVVKEWYDQCQGDDKRAAKSLFGKINQLTVAAEDKKVLLQHGILAFESLRLKDELSKLQELDAEHLSDFITIAGRLDSIEATHYYQVMNSRLEVIRGMEKLVDEEALEKAVQHYLAEHLWLLDPTWDKGTMNVVVEKRIQKALDSVNAKLTEEERKARLDVYYRKNASRHVIIELKRSGRKLKYIELMQQIDKYSEAIESVLSTLDDGNEFEIIVLLGNRNKYSQKQLAALEEMNARVMYYDELLKNAMALYTDFIERSRNMAIYNNIITELSPKE